MDDVEDFQGLFTGLQRAYCKVTRKKTPSKALKKETYNCCVRDKISTQQYEDHLAGKQAVGVYVTNEENQCCFGCIDIDDYDFNEDKTKALLQRIANLPLIPCKSKSGGFHLYYFCKMQSADRVKKYLKILVGMIGYSNKAEIFPKTIELHNEKDVGAAITIPYFKGAKTDCFALKDGVKVTLKDFNSWAQEIKEQSDTSKIPSQNDDKEFVSDILYEAPPCLQTIGTSGCPEGGRNNFVYDLAVYVRMRYGQDLLAAKLDELHRATVPDPLSDQEVKKIVSSVAGKSKAYFYKCDDTPICNFCNKDLCKQRTFGIGNPQHTVINCVIENMVKLLSEPPVWYADVNGKRIELTTDDITSPFHFKRTCVNQLNIMPTGMTGKRFEGVMTKALKDCVEIPAPENVGFLGQMRDYFEGYLIDYAAGSRVKEDILLGKYYYEDGYVHLRAQDYMHYLSMQNCKVTSHRDVYKTLKQINDVAGGDADCYTKLCFKNRQIRVWRVKQELLEGMFKDEEQDFDFDED